MLLVGVLVALAGFAVYRLNAFTDGLDKSG